MAYATLCNVVYIWAKLNLCYVLLLVSIISTGYIIDLFEKVNLRYTKGLLFIKQKNKKSSLLKTPHC